MSPDAAGPPACGRYAPSPSGLIHVGNARTALVAWLSARAGGGRFLWRLEDLDPPRVLKGAAEAAIDDLRWLGLEWDEGPDVGGPRGPYEQSRRQEHYERALEVLARTDRLFPCRLSRKDLKNLASAPHGSAARSPGAAGSSSPYPARLRPRDLPAGWFRDFQARADSPAPPDAGAALRFKVSPRPVRFRDLALGDLEQRVDLEVGDFVLKRRDGLYAYQLAVVVDDLAMGVNEVVRGMDLVDSTARQIQLIEALSGQEGCAGEAERPRYGHVPLVLNSRGEKLSKRDGGLTLRSLRARGLAAEKLVGRFAHSLGLRDRPEPCRAEELVGEFSWSALRERPGDWILPEDFAERLA
ncbi:MAG: glutamate--tRNA ligase family protein [Acidobacteriota bacterium]